MNITSLPFALNRAGSFQLPADGWIQLAPYGELRAPLHPAGGKPGEEVQIVQVLNREVADGIVARFAAEAKDANFPGALIDYDHFSTDTEKSSRAAGWIEQVEARDSGLWGQVRFSASGKAAVEGGDYRLFSPVLGFEPRAYKAGDRVRPAALLRGALTNDPRFKGMTPISNRQDSPTEKHNPSTDTAMNYKAELLKLLGLPDTATDADVTAALASKMTESESRKTELQAAQNRATTAETALIEHDLDKAGLQGDARISGKALLTKNRAEGLAFIAAIAKPESGYTPTHNRSSTRTPGDNASAAMSDKNRQRDQAVQEYMTVNRCDFGAAWNAVRGAKPALFAEA